METIISGIAQRPVITLGRSLTLNELSFVTQAYLRVSGVCPASDQSVSGERSFGDRAASAISTHEGDFEGSASVKGTDCAGERVRMDWHHDHADAAKRDMSATQNKFSTRLGLNLEVHRCR